MDLTPFQLETPLPPKVVLCKMEETLRANRSLRFVRPVLLGRIAGSEILLWRSRRAGQSSLYPALKVSVQPNGSGSRLECRVGYNSRAIVISAVGSGTIGALLVLVFGISHGLTRMLAAGAAFLALVVLSVFDWGTSRCWATLLSDDRELLLTEFRDALREDGF